jgi:DNA-binding NarL/FixJ family response regulator
VAQTLFRVPVDTGLPVLLVDSSPAFRSAVRLLLRRSRRFRLVGETATASDAMILAARLRPGLVLVDLHLPDGSGMEVAQWIRRLMPPPLVLLCSGYATHQLPRDVAATGLPHLDKAEVSEAALSDLLPPRERERRTG